MYFFMLKFVRVVK